MLFGDCTEEVEPPMRAPRLEIRLDKLAENARKLSDLFGARGVRLTAVVKGVCGAPRVARALRESGIRSLGDSRLANLRRLKQSGLDGARMLIRSPGLRDAEETVEYADISLNSEISVVRRLAEAARRRGRTHGVILMVELGDLREGILPSDIDAAVTETLRLEGVRLAGIGTNLACFGGVRPSERNMGRLSEIARGLEKRHGIELEYVSGGNSANYQWFRGSRDLGSVNHLRVGEAILLGRDTLTREPIPGLNTDAFTLVAEVIELKTKPSRPSGERGQDAFGRVRAFEDRGLRRRAILAIGRQDVDVEALSPRIPAEIVGASSDHLVVDVTGADEVEMGGEIKFDLGYSALIRAVTSPYVEEVYVPAGPAVGF